MPWQKFISNLETNGSNTPKAQKILCVACASSRRAPSRIVSCVVIQNRREVGVLRSFAQDQ